ncbi:putative RING-H2 finger protein ATL21A [Papaver somniferum]|uniref:putative RING-H2 finger protein ATL21A n=1 Tax=Papaver somniferum TaxID=3469 RepID=UPI000E7046F2|nr:putative RING-H2 finger protein ATL21A [Papaver somniferum]
MGASIIIFPFFLFCFFCFPCFIIASVENCSNNRCSKFDPSILYPFRIKGRQSEPCGYRGFDLTCNNMSRTVLELPFSEPFFVQGINYGNTHNEIQLVDPDNCLARRFLKQVNLSGTPFIGIEYKNYSFFSCQSETNELAKDISCLSNSTHQVFATANTTSSSSSWPHANCTLIVTVQVPVESGKDVYEHPWFAYTNVLHLTWPWKQAPYCKRNGCNERSNFPSFRDPDVPRRGGNIFLIVMGILIPTAIATYLCYIILKSKGFFSGRGIAATSWSSSSELVSISTGLDGPAVKSLPTIVVRESGRLPNPDNNICSICLSEYQPNETLKTMPACNHCFHVDCIDVWLLLNSTCPICRISPVSEKNAIGTPQG